eukprot:PhF_6_TR39899/c0_g1_i1/m.59304
MEFDLDFRRDSTLPDFKHLRHSLLAQQEDTCGSFEEAYERFHAEYVDKILFSVGQGQSSCNSPYVDIADMESLLTKLSQTEMNKLLLKRGPRVVATTNSSTQKCFVTSDHALEELSQSSDDFL